MRGLGLAHLEVGRVGPSRSVAAAVKALKSRPEVEYAEPDYLRAATDATDEPYYEELWGLHNTGQVAGFPATAGVPDIDIDGREASSVTLGSSSVVVAVIDDGVDFSHPDLASRKWVNPGESGSGRETNGIDDDGNGYADDVNGWDFVNGDASVHDVGQDEHGTHVAGTIAASVNGVGIAGVAPNVRIMALKFIGPDGSGTTSDVIAAIDYARARGVKIVNASWGGPGYDQSLKDAIDTSGMLFVAAAGNSGLNNDTSVNRSYPAAFTSTNVLAVAAVNNRGNRSAFSNYGKTSVDISAPGEGILSTWPPIAGLCASPCYAWLDGTSMAAPHVTGVAALAASVKPSRLPSPRVLKTVLLDTGKYDSATAGFTLTGRIVDARRAVDATPPIARAPVASITTGSALATSAVPIRVAWPAASDAETGVRHYSLQQSTDGGAWVSVPLASAASTSVTRKLASGHSYRFQVRAVDRAWNYGSWKPGALFRLGTYQENHAKITYGGSWSRAASASASGGYVRSSTTTGSTAKFTFIGSRIALVAPRGATLGRANIYIDGLFAATVDLYSASTLSRRVIYTKAWGTAGTHTISLRVAGTSGRPRFSVDALVVVR
jgi:subtilisin family serine protease